VVAEGQTRRRISGGAEGLTETTITLPNPQRWDIDHPALYTVHSELRIGGKVMDTYDTPSGVRTIRLDLQKLLEA